MTFSGRFESLPQICRFFTKGAREARLDSRATYAVKLAVDEACSNIIEHAYGGENKGEIQCTWELIERGLKIIIRDWGKPFDPESMPKPNFNVPLENLPKRGAGLLMIHGAMDEVRFDPSTGQGNVLTMTKKASVQSQA
jgi:serine/threonine-protein kinase RsbW